jgi:glucan-binding YG repeat protein
MVGTVSVAADAAVAKTPEFTASIAKDGTVTVAVEDGIKDYNDEREAVVCKYDKNGNVTARVSVDLEYNTSKKAYIGKDEAAAGGEFVFEEITLSKWNKEGDKKGTTQKIKTVSFYASYDKGVLSYVNYGTGTRTDEYNEKEKRWITTNQDSESSSKAYWTKINKLQYEYHGTSTTVGDKDDSTTKSSSERKDYEQYKGNYVGKTLTESEGKYVYSKKQGDYVPDTSKYTQKKYNAKDVLIDTKEVNNSTTFNKAETEYTDVANTTEKDYSSKGYLRYTTKTTESQQYVKDDDDIPYWEWTEKDHVYNTKTTNTDGAVTYTEDTATTYGKDGKSYKSGTTQKQFNAFTGALVSSYMSDYVYGENKKEKKWESTETETEVYNNDDGSRRYKVVTTSVDGLLTKETHYDNNNKVAGEKTYNKDNGVLAWTDGNGKVIGRTQGDDDNGTKISEVWFKNRTGALYHWKVTDVTTDKKGVTTTKVLTYTNGKKSNERQVIVSEDERKEYDNGVLTYSADYKKHETKQYDSKGNLISSSKWDDDEEVNKFYNADNKLVKTTGYDDDYKWVTKHYNPATGKVTKSEVSYTTDDSKEVVDHLDAKNNVLWSEKTFDDKEGKSDVRVKAYYNEKGKEFARTLVNGYTENGVTYSQNLYGKMDYENATGAVERKVSWTDRDYQKRTDTTNNLKWTVTNGKAGTPLKRQDKTVTTWDEDKTEVNTYKGGVLSSNTVIERNDYYKLDTSANYNPRYDYENVAKTTVKTYDWYNGKMTDMYKYIYPDQEDSPYTYYKDYDRYGNLQTYSVTDDTDDWNWTHTYYMTGTLKSESWYDGLDGDSSYSAVNYLDGSLQRKSTGSHYEQYNKDGSYREWTDTVDGVTNTWLYNSDGVLQGYIWNQKTDANGVRSYEMWDENSTLLYTTTTYSDYDEVLGGTNSTTIRTDPAGNKWERTFNANGEDTLTVTLKNKNNGWQYAVGEWFYVEKGAPVKSAWRQIDGGWYYFDDNAMMVKGLVKIQDANDSNKYTTYAANDDGRVTRGWIAWEDEVGDVKWAYTNDNGEVTTGWKNIGGKWYYFTDGWNYNKTEYKEDANWTQSGERGEMVTGAWKIWNSDWTDKHTYFFNEDGTWDNSPGWKLAGDNTYQDIEWHYYNKDGVEVTGWNLIDGKWYYFNEDGVMKNGWVKEGNNWFFLNRKDGSLATNGWVEDVYEGWYYMDKNGQYQTGWLKDGKNWYYLKPDGEMASKEWAKYDNKWYFMGADGSMTTGWQKDHDKWYYMSKDGSMKSNSWEGSGNTWYYLGDDGAMLTNTDKTIDGKVYHFDENGLCTNPY